MDLNVARPAPPLSEVLKCITFICYILIFELSLMLKK